MATIPAEVTTSIPEHSRSRAIRKRAVTPKKTRLELAREFNELPADALANSAQLAAFLNCSEAKLERDRWAGGGIPYIKNGRCVRYVKRVALEYVQGRIRTSTTEAAA